MKQVDHLVRKGIYRGYVDFEENDPYLRGRLLLARQLQTNTAQLTRFHQRTNELTADLREDRILKFTLWQLSRTSFDDAVLRRQLRRTLTAFSEAPPGTRSALRLIVIALHSQSSKRCFTRRPLIWRDSSCSIFL